VPAYSLNAPISMTAVPKGKHLFNIQFKDSTNKWSVVQADSFMKASLPIASFNVNNTVFCESGIVSFSNTSIDGDTYAWNFGDNTTSTLTSVTHTYNAIGNYTASLVITDTITNQTSSYSMAIIVSGKPVFSLGNDISICPSASITFSAPLGMQSYSWSTGSTAYSLQPVNAGTIWCTATNTNGCSYTDTLVFGFIPLPTAQFNHTTNGMLVNFFNTSASALTYTWNFGDTQTSNLANPVHTYTLPGSYTVTLVVANSCGTSTITDIVTVSDVGMAQLSLQNKVMVFPNPNRGEFELYLEMNDEEQVTVGLWSLDGKLLEERTLLLSHGALQQTYRLEDWSNGVYHLVITGNKNRVVKKVIVAK
jgi:PKD repeat protein